MNTRERATNGQPSGRQFRFNDYVLDLDSGFLRRNGEEVPLRPKAFDALVCLVQRPGTLVSKNDLVDAVWAGAAVTDNSLSQCLFELRRALADDDQTMIRTVARRGFVFQAQVSASRASETGSAAGTPTGALASRESTVAPAASDAAVRPTNDPRPAPGASARRMAGIALLVTGLLVGLVWLSMHRALTISEAPVQLTDFNDSAVQPSLSHDGRMVAFIRGGGFGTPGVSRGRVYLKMLPNGQAVELQSDAAARDGPVFSRSNPVFSPDDARIIYTALLSGLRWDSWQVPVLGGAPQPFLPNASGVTWLDDHRLLFSTITAGIHMGIATSTESRDAYKEIYFPTREDGMAHRSAAAPDRKSLLIVEMTGGTWTSCRLLPADGSSGGRAVGPPGGQCTSAAWSPDGRWMYFSSNAGGAYHIWRQRYPDGEPEQFTFGPTEEEGTAITSDGKYLITSMGLRHSVISLHQGGQERKLTDEGLALSPTIAPDGTHMLYLVRTTMSRGAMSGELWSVDLASGNRQRALPGLLMANYSLSPDGHAVVYSTPGQSKDDGIWIASLDRLTPPRQIVRGTDIRAFYGGPGEIVYMAEDRLVYRMKEDGSRIEQIAPNTGRDLLWRQQLRWI